MTSEVFEPTYGFESESYWLTRCIKFACDVHKGLDKSGLPEILHPLRVMAAGDPLDVSGLKVRILHDCIEDLMFSGESQESIINRMKIECRLSGHEVYLLLLLTHEQNQSYSDYIRAISRSEEATLIKIDDIKDNLTRPHSGIPLKDINRMKEKYLNALEIFGGE